MRSKSHQVPSGLWQYKIDLAVAGAKDLLAHVPEIKAIGLTGSVAWGDVGVDDDLDYLIVTSARRVFTVRWGCYWRAIKMGKKRRFGSERDSWCLNLFLDERALLVPTIKRSEFGAWQLLRLRPLYDPEKIFVRLLAVNRAWIKKLLANNYRSQKNILLPAMITAVKVPEKSKLISGILGDWWEKFLFYGQWLYQRGHQTREVVTPQQIFFHPLIRD